MERVHACFTSALKPWGTSHEWRFHQLDSIDKIRVCVATTAKGRRLKRLRLSVLASCRGPNLANLGTLALRRSSSGSLALLVPTR